ncbi:hypothetical protein EDEG_01022 [Edhazardia aedis USNM 41457]|uniref:Uncharacterized protein n=1 Tax=Edhazardia aedis (strain USNM 41457) TaxID=1003232 RepID=J9DQG1_EDHAE|nr:hypothetical protein EDEG_01022 [Edhazardia aedis USNM 41457]|eukprot:EJW04800.1 hypothetical protein EDEG_01022 [Edhazardia aedis USNM 41457]
MKEKIEEIKFNDIMMFILNDFMDTKDVNIFLQDLQKILKNKKNEQFFYYSNYLEKILKFTNEAKIMPTIKQYFNPNSFEDLNILYSYISSNFDSFLYEEIFYVLNKIPIKRIIFSEFSILHKKFEIFLFGDKHLLKTYLKFLQKIDNVKISQKLFNKILEMPRFYNILINYTNYLHNVLVLNDSDCLKVRLTFLAEKIFGNVYSHSELVLNFTVLLINLIENGFKMDYSVISLIIEKNLQRFESGTLEYVSLLILFIGNKESNIDINNLEFHKRNVQSLLYISGITGTLSSTKCSRINNLLL